MQVKQEIYLRKKIDIKAIISFTAHDASPFGRHKPLKKQLQTLKH